MSGKTISTTGNRLDSVQVQSSAYGMTIPMVWGVARVAGNLAWYGGFQAIAHTDTQGGKGGAVKTQNTTFTYQADVMMLLCHGRISGIPTVWRGKERHTGGVASSSIVTTFESFTVGSVPYAITLAHAAAFATLMWIEHDLGGYDGAQTLALGTDYTLGTGGALTIVNPDWTGLVLGVQYQYTSTTPSTAALDELGLTLIPGVIGQSPWSGLASYGAQSIGYSGLCLVAASGYDLGTGAKVDNHNFEVVGPMAYHLGSSVPDVDPSVMLRDLLTNARSGAGMPGSALDAWVDWSAACVASGLLVSPALTDQQRAADIVQTAADLTNAVPAWSSGRLKMIPLADQAATANGVTYTPNLTPVWDLDDDAWTAATAGADAAAPTVAAKSPADQKNHWRVEYLDRAHEYAPAIAEAEDAADIATRGRISADILQAHWICDGAIARQVAQIALQRSLYITNTYTLTLPEHYSEAEPGDLVTLTDPGINCSLKPVRITDIEESASGDLQLTLQDVPFGTASAAIYGSQAPAGYKPNYNADPGNCATPVIFEAPADRTTTGLALMVAVKGNGSSPDWGGAQIWLSLDGTHYRQIATVYGGARYGTLSATVGSTAAVQGLGAAQLLSGSAADAAALQTLCYIGGSTPEYFAYQTATLTGAGAYTLSTLTRAVYGTSSAAHSISDAFVRVDDRVAMSDSLEPGYVGSTVSIKCCSFNQYGGAVQSLASVSATTYTITGAMGALSVPPGTRTYRQSTDPASGAWVPNGTTWQNTSTGVQYERVAGAWQATVGPLSVGTASIAVGAVNAPSGVTVAGPVSLTTAINASPAAGSQQLASFSKTVSGSAAGVEVDGQASLSPILNSTPAGIATMALVLYRDATELARSYVALANSTTQYHSASVGTVIDVPAAGTYTYSLKAEWAIPGAVGPHDGSAQSISISAGDRKV